MILPRLDPLDKRLNAYRADLADARLEGKVKTNGFSQGSAATIVAPVVNVQQKPERDAAIDTQMIFGEPVTVFDERNRYYWVQSKRDGYVGWIKKDTVILHEIETTHRVNISRTFLYPNADMKTPPLMQLAMGSELAINGEATIRGTNYLTLEDGSAVIASHVQPVENKFQDYVSVAEYLTHTPYLWAGTTTLGLDCSGLVQLAMRMAGHSVLRDSDMQSATIGSEIESGELYGNLKRGDLIFWRGHVAICQGITKGKHYLIHANGHSMTVASELLKEAIERIEYLYEKPIGFRRPQI